MNEFWQTVIGDGSKQFFLACLFFGYLAAFVSVLMQTTNRNPMSKNTPVCFSWSFLWCDNSKRFIANIILIFFAIRFSKQWFGYVSGPCISAVIGFGFDKLAQIAKDKFGWLETKAKEDHYVEEVAKAKTDNTTKN